MPAGASSHGITSAAASSQSLLDVRTVLYVLKEVADVAAELLVRLEAEGDDGDEAEGKPLPALQGPGGVVAAVLALEGEVLGTFEGGRECWRRVNVWAKRALWRVGEGWNGMGSGVEVEMGEWKHVLCVPHVKKKNIVGGVTRFCGRRGCRGWCRGLCSEGGRLGSLLSFGSSERGARGVRSGGVARVMAEVAVYRFGRRG